ncbi:ABC transporter substrate-binding protein [Nesterenkonia haasae]|uniref:ABC transporter substrate-binding protein n=1 Tax=Nesterenkonia haasae TaxID=2587813 RepID=UPI001391DEEF|nr:ABC transporter substrate-binding protein [Nesterenkonia haasae]
MTHSPLSPTKAAAGVVLTGLLTLTACGGDDASPGAEQSEEELDLDALELTDDQEAELTELYEAATESGETDVTIYAGHHDEFLAIYEGFEERFPGLTVVPETLVGADLETTMNAERETGQHVADIISNPNADRYAEQGFAEEFRPSTYETPEWAEGQIHESQFEDPEGFYHAPWALLFSFGYNTEVLEESDLPETWEDLADPEWDGQLTMMTPAVPGGMQTVLTILLQGDAVDEDWLRTVADQSRIVAQDQLGLQSVSSGEYAADISSAATSLRNAQESGAPVDIHFLENPVVATEKWMLADNAPNREAAQLYLNYIYTLEAQEQVMISGNFPLVPHESLESPYGWPNLEDIDFVSLPSQSQLREEIAANQDLFQEITATD